MGSSDGDFKRKHPNVATRRPVAVLPPRGALTEEECSEA
jgi:hypothetical protein